MERRKWDSKTKALIVLQSLKGKALAELCAEHQVSQAQVYAWRDQLLRNAAVVFDNPQITQRETRLAQENARLKRLLGELTLALKKSDEVFA